jgi:hypothetical protein
MRDKSRVTALKLKKWRTQPLLADIVAKVPKDAAANFPPKNETSDNCRSTGLQTRYQNRL